MNLATQILGTLAGLGVVVLIFAGAWWFVSAARRGNRHVREIRGDPHADRHPTSTTHTRDDDRRDIPQ
jgi:hypothetical protein